MAMPAPQAWLCPRCRRVIPFLHYTQIGSADDWRVWCYVCDVCDERYHGQTEHLDNDAR